jgi:hypothetical protein
LKQLQLQQKNMPPVKLDRKNNNYFEKIITHEVKGREVVKSEYSKIKDKKNRVIAENEKKAT